MICDTIIVGAGPAALSAGLYASRYFLNHQIIGKDLGGTMGSAHKVENYPGFESVGGFELAQKMAAHAQKFGSKIKYEEVLGIKKNKNKIFEVFTNKTAKDEPYLAHTIILATGMQRRTLKIPGEKELLGKGVSYCSTCDAAFFKDKVVVVVGGANAATMSAIHLADYAKMVYLIYRGNELKGEPSWNQRVLDNSKIDVIYNTKVVEIKGENSVNAIVLNRTYKSSTEIKTDGVFIEIGFEPVTTDIVSGLAIETDKAGFIKIDKDCKTNVPGVLAAGDTTNGSNNFKQIVTAVGEGAVAAKTAFDLKARRGKHENAKINYA